MKNSEKGITLIEIIVVIAIITLFSMILIADYPKIKRQFALSRAVYKFAQDLRKTQDLGLSGVQLKNKDGSGDIVNAKGYGIYINLSVPVNLNIPPSKQYIIYADTYMPTDYMYTSGDYIIETGDYIIETVDISKGEPGVFISGIKSGINNISNNWTSINFNPPNPNTTIENLNPGENSIEIVFALSVDPLITRAVSINTSGLIEVK